MWVRVPFSAPLKIQPLFKGLFFMCRINVGYLEAVFLISDIICTERMYILWLLKRIPRLGNGNLTEKYM